MDQGLADSSACTDVFDLSPSLICMVNSATILEDQYAILQISPLDKIPLLRQRRALLCSPTEFNDWAE